MKLTNIDRADHVLEIGTGKGHITREIARRASRVTTYEIDPSLARRFTPIDGVTLHCRDFLTASLPRGEYKVFANIPFDRTTDIIKKLTRSVNAPSEAWLIVEYGAARRFCGDGLAALALKPFFDVRIVNKILRSEFHPSPSCDAALLHLKRKAAPDIELSERGLYIDFVEKGLRHGIHSLLTNRQVHIALRASEHADVPRSGTLLYVQWLCLFRAWRQCRR